MNLRIVPALPSSPTVIFSLNWHNLPSSLPLPSFFSHQMATCQESGVPLPRNTLALDKAVGFHLLLEAVTFDLARGMVCVSWLDKRVQEWAIQDVQGLQASLEDVLDCVKQSGEEAEKEKKAAAEAKTSGTSQTSMPEVASTPISAHKRSRTASGIFSSLVASFIAPTAESPSAQLYRSRKSKSMSSIVPMYHKQNIFHPANKRDSFPTSTVPQSRFLRRQARAKLVDVFRFYVAGRLTTEMRSTGIVGEELRERGILDDLDADEEMEGGNLPGTSGYAAAGGYVAYMARSMLKTAFSQAKSEDDSMSSSSEDSMLMTPKNPSESSLPSDVDGKNPARPASPARRRATTPTPQARQIRHLSSVLIGLTQKDKRTTSDEREQLDLVEERSLRRRWSLCEASQAARARSVSRSRSSSIDWTKPVVPSPLRKVEVVEDVKDEEEIIVMRQSPVSEISIPFPSDSIVPDDEEGADITEQGEPARRLITNPNPLTQVLPPQQPCPPPARRRRFLFRLPRVHDVRRFLLPHPDFLPSRPRTSIRR